MLNIILERYMVGVHTLPHEVSAYIYIYMYMYVCMYISVNALLVPTF